MGVGVLADKDGGYMQEGEAQKRKFEEEGGWGGK